MPAPEQVRAMFNRIAHRYDLMNCLMTFGRIRAWRKRVIQLAQIKPGDAVLDVGTGTGALARLALHSCPGISIIGCDFSQQMLAAGRESSFPDDIDWTLANALALPFPDERFDCVVSGYLARNAPNPARAFREQSRVLKQGGRLVCLDTAPPPRGVLSPIIRFYMHEILPRTASIVTGSREAYEYLSRSTSEFMSTDKLAALIQASGDLKVYAAEGLMFGTQSLVAARKTPGLIPKSHFPPQGRNAGAGNL